jgi:type IV pilus assembly protein PilB
MPRVRIADRRSVAAEPARRHVDAEPLAGRVLLGTLLVRNGYVTRDGLAEALEEKERSGKLLGQVLIDLGMITSNTLAQALAEQYGFEYLDLSVVEVDGEATVLLPENVARRYQALPVKFLDETVVLVAVADPTNLLAHDDLRLALGLDARIAVAESDQLEAAITRNYRVPLEFGEILSEVVVEGPPINIHDIREGSEEMAPAIRLVNEVIGSALDHGASDIHFEPQAEHLVVRLRVDGVTRELITIPTGIQPAVTARLKIMGGLDIAQRRAPQDGRVTIRVAGEPMDLRIALLPTTYGEQVVLRILQRSAHGPLSMADLGMEPETEATFLRAIARPYGAIIACGPTGSGKTTTLYAALELLNDPGRVLVTIEDPVEYQMPGVGQVEVNPPAGLTFARGLRTILRSDPDAILVGEIRDEETARIAMQAATTGQLVLTTLHTHNAASAIVRLKDMGIDSGMLATSINCIVGQRLVRRLCTSCRQPYPPSEQERAEFGPADFGDELELYRASGCNYCFGTGFRGRVALYEVVPMQAEFLHLIHAPTDEVFAAAIEDGMKGLRESGLKLCLAGVTSLEEVRRVTGERVL